jgi:tetratricopeptide (TPR) repeat protein
VKIAQMIRGRSREAAALERLHQLWREGKYEEVEAGARALEAESGRLRRRGRGLAVAWHAKALATAAACAHGRGAQVLAELESLTAELNEIAGPGRALLLMIRSNHMLVLNSEGRYEEAEAEGLDILRGVTRLKHLAQVWDIELSVLDNLVDALCGQARYEEAEAIARGNLPRAEGSTVAALHCGLVHSLNGQGRYDEALTEALRFDPCWDRSQSGSLRIGTAVALHGLGRRSEAEATVREALTDCERFLHPDHPRFREARMLLARITADDPPAPTAEEARS